MNKFRVSLAALALTVFVSVAGAIPGYAAGSGQEVKLELAKAGSGYEIVVPGFKEVKEVSFVGMDGTRQTENAIVMGAPDPDAEGHYPILQVMTTSESVYSFDAHLGTYQDGELSHFEGVFANGRLLFNPAIAVSGASFTEFAKDKVFNLDFSFYDKDKNTVFAVEDINILFVDKKEIPAQAVPSNAKVIVDGKEISFEAYNIGGSNYFKLRDLAKVLDGSPKQFGVEWDDDNNAINLAKLMVYEADGSELALTGKQAAQTAMPSVARIYIDGAEADLASYNIGGFNYYKLRDLAKQIDFNVTWDDEHNTVGIDTKNGYVEPEA